MEEPSCLQLTPLYTCFAKCFKQPLILIPLTFNLLRVCTQPVSEGYEGLRTFYRITIRIYEVAVCNSIRSIMIQTPTVRT